MRIYVYGVRGSTPAPGPQFNRYGGHTSCVGLSLDVGPPSLVLDAGTGLRELGYSLDGVPFQGTILLGHLHWDHTTGLPFFSAGCKTGSDVRVMMPAQGDPVEVLARIMSPPHFPVRPDQLEGNWVYEAMEEGEHDLEGFKVLALEIPHKGSRTFGFRITNGTSVVCYMSDHWPLKEGDGPDGFGAYHDVALRLASGADVMFHDAQYTNEEFPTHREFGHTTMDYAVGLAEKAGVKRVLLFHHNPPRTDDQLDEIVKSYRARDVVVEAAAQGTVIDLPAS